jgi:hypothetical protein
MRNITKNECTNAKILHRDITKKYCNTFMREL